MKTTTEKLPRSRIAITIELSPNEIKPQLERAASTIAAELKTPGFRPGKMPYQLVAQKVGEATIYQEASQAIVEKTYPPAVLQTNLLVVGRPEIAILKSAPGNPFVYKATVALLPEIKLGDYKSFNAIKREQTTVTPEEVTKAIEQLRSLRASKSLVDRPAQKGDLVEVDFDISVDQVKIDGGSSKNHPIIIGEDHFVPGFEDNLVGIKKGEKKQFTLLFPKDYRVKNLADKEGSFAVTMNAVYEVKKPELTDDFVKQLGHLGTVQTFRQEIEKNLKAEADSAAERRFEEALINELINRSTFGEIPELLLESERDKMIHELRHDIEHRGLAWEKYLESLKKTEPGLRQEFTDRATKRVKASLIIRHLAKERNVTVTDEEIQKELEIIKQRYQYDQEVLKQLATPAYKQYVENLLANRKVIEYLKAQQVSSPT